MYTLYTKNAIKGLFFFILFIRLVNIINQLKGLIFMARLLILMVKEWVQ